MTPTEFIAKWQASTRNERAACQEHFIDLCRLLDQPTPAARPPGGDGMRAGECGGPEEAAAETRAFFVGPVHQTNGDGRPAVEILCQTA